MLEKSPGIIFLEIFIIIAILGTLSAIALPSIGRMFGKGEVESRDLELHNIQTAVTEMLCDSTAGTLSPVGPTDDMSLVRTSDTPPLVLKDYLQGLESNQLQTDCTYNFAADGTVVQECP